MSMSKLICFGFSFTAGNAFVGALLAASVAGHPPAH